MPESQVDEIKNRLDVADVIRGYMKIEKSGVNLRGLCPFHREKTPSFFVSPPRQLWRCFGCGIGGDMFNFVMQIEGVEFPDALKTLADRAGVRLKSYDPKIRSEKTRLYEICEKASQFFEKQLGSSSLGQEARDYLLERGINDESVSGFRIGFAPDSRNGLYEFLRDQGYSPAEIFKAGVTIESQSSSYYDRFRGRIIFPIFDLNGQVIGFGGRIFFGKNQVQNAELAKYINTPQTLLYDKSRVLYGLDKAKMAIREQEACVLVEGYTDVIAAHQAGSKNAVATSGTALTEQQLDIIHRYTENLVTAFDMDIAGDNATRRGIDLAQNKGFNIKVLVLPEGKDPAEIIQKNKKTWEKIIKTPLSIGDFYFSSAMARFDKKTPEGIRSITNTILPFIKQLPSEIERSYWVQKLSSELNCSEDSVWSDLSRINVETQRSDERKAENVEEKKITREDMLYTRLLAAVTKDSTCLELITKSDVARLPKDFMPAVILSKMSIKRGSVSGGKDGSEEFTGEERAYLDELSFQEEIFPSFSDDVDIKEEVGLCLKTLKRLGLQEELRKLAKDMKSGNMDDKLLQRFQKTSMELVKL